MSTITKTLLAMASALPLLGSLASAAPTRILCVGDSLTATSPGYRGPLSQKLKEGGYDVEFVGPNKQRDASGGQLDHGGFGGYTIGPGPSKADEWSNGRGNILANIEHLLESDPQIVVLLIGTNEFFNIGKLQPEHNPDRDGPGRLGGLVERIHELKPEAKVLVGSVMPVKWSRDFAKGFNAALPALFKDKPWVRLVDTAALSGFVNEDWSGDGLHPSASGYGKLSNVWFDALKSELKADPAKKAAADAGRAAEEEAVADLAKRPVNELMTVWDFSKNKPGYAYLAWEPLANSGASTADGWKVDASPDGGLGVVFPQPLDLKSRTHLLVHLRAEDGASSEVIVKLMCAGGERAFKIPASDISKQMKALRLPFSAAAGSGDLGQVTQLQVQGNFDKQRKFAYALGPVEAGVIKPRK